MATIVKKPEGGFVFITGMAFMRAWWAYKRDIIKLQDFRVWLACHELVAERCGATAGVVPEFRLSEVRRLLGCKRLAEIKRSVERIEIAGLLRWTTSAIEFLDAVESHADFEFDEFKSTLQAVTNHRRKVPVPRRVLRYLCRSRRPALIATTIGHLLRCLYYRRSTGCTSQGLCKAIWISSVFEVDLRSVKSARKELQRLGLLIRQDTSQWRLNRWGPSIEINLAWAPPGFVARRKPPPRKTHFCTESPPPDSNKELSSKDITTRNAPQRSGFFKPGNQEPNLRSVSANDLKDDSRLLRLYDQALAEGVLRDSESARLRFVAAAEHARAKGERNPPGLFVAVIRRGLWSFVTHADEDSARKRLRSEPWLCRAMDQPRRCSGAGQTPKEEPVPFAPRDVTGAQVIRTLVQRSLASVG